MVYLIDIHWKAQNLLFILPSTNTRPHNKYKNGILSN